jgi:hypothetical protein
MILKADPAAHEQGPMPANSAASTLVREISDI